MMTRKLTTILALVAIMIALSSTLLFASDADEIKLLQAELKLAQKQQLYFVADLGRNKFMIKVRGVTLREMDIERANTWGIANVVSTHVLQRKIALFSPKRKKINPVAAQKDGVEEKKSDGKFELDALELPDMPSNYRLLLSDGLALHVRNSSDRWYLGALMPFRTLGRLVTRPLITVWSRLRRTPYESLDLVMGADDARAIYWSFYEGLPLIVYKPSSK